MSRNTSFGKLAQEITEVYETIINQKILSNKNESAFLSAIEFLKNIENTNNLTVGNVDFSVIYDFFCLVEDVIGLISASEGSFEPLKLGDTKLIGRLKEIRGVYKGDDNTIAQHMCALLFQGWIKDQNTFQISKDLKNIVTEGKACDFLLESKQKEKILIECKRIHSDQSFNCHHDLIEKVSKKSVNWIEKSLEQIENTENFLGLGRCERHVLLDISSFGRQYYREIKDYSIIGLLYEQEINAITLNILKYCSADIDCITLCWTEVYIFENKPRALIYRTVNFPLTEKELNFKDYGGWSIEFYPLGKQTNEFKELRISKVALSKAWIRASWHACTDNLLTFGPTDRLYQ